MPTICLIPGDGVGQEVIPAAAQVLAAVAPDLRFTEAEAGWHCFRRRGTALPGETLAAVAAADATLFGATQSPSGEVEGYHSPILALRRHFDLYANLRPVAGQVQVPGALSDQDGTRISHAGDRGPGTFVDLLIVRENTEGLYSGRERRDGDTAIAERVITRGASQRIARTAFDLARQRAMERVAAAQPSDHPVIQPRVTIVHKANVLKVSDGLFREAYLEAARDYPDVTASEMLVDTAAMWLVKDPARFDVVVTTNLFGDILSDLAAGLIGGLGVAPSANVGAGRVAVFEPVHGSAPDIAGQGIANPVGAILSGAMLLEHLGLPDAARRVRQAVNATAQAGLATPDLGGTATTAQVVHAIHRSTAAPRRPMTTNPSYHAHHGSRITDYAADSDDLDLLSALLQIPSLSGQEATAATFLVDWMGAHGFDAFVDAAGNAVGIRDGGPDEAGNPPQDIVLLGHIDTVAGQVPVRIEDGKLYGRGAVDAKGPLAAFAVAAAAVRMRPGWRIAVAGAVEEEAGTSRGARFAATQYRPAHCIIGEPSGAARVTLGYKGWLLCDVRVRRPVAHTAGPAGTAACEIAVDYWNRVSHRVAGINHERPRVFDQVQPSLRGFQSYSDGLWETAELLLGFRLPLEVGPDALKAVLEELAGPVELSFRGEGAAYLADKNNALVRAFLAAIRGQGVKPGFVVKTGSSDMNVVGPGWQCPIVAYGPGDSSLDHTPEEHVEIAEWRQGTAVLMEVLERIMAG